MSVIKEILNNNIVTFVLGAFAGYFLDKLFDLIVKLVKGIPLSIVTKKQKEFEATVSSKEFIDFSAQLMKDYYGEEYFTEVFGKKFPVYSTEGNAAYPFDSLCERGFSEDKEIPFEKQKNYKKYKKLVGKHIRRPKMQGFMLDKFILDSNQKITGMDTWVGTYDENVYTSHILEYEVYTEFLKYRKTGKYNINDLAMRNKIHKNHDKKDVLLSGCNRASLLGVQLLIVFKDKKTGRYQVLTIKRSEDVSAKPGFYQFVPSGGFEVYENSDEHDIHELKQNYNVLWAIYREYLEELLLGKENDYEYGQGGETIEKIEKEENIRKITEMIECGTAHFEFLGSVVDLCGLRNELSFVLRIDDPDYSDNIFKSNNESKKINRIFIDDIQSEIDVNKLNPPSAALWGLFTRSELYSEIACAANVGES